MVSHDTYGWHLLLHRYPKVPKVLGVWELLDGEIKEKIRCFASDSSLVTWTRSAEQDMASTRGMTRAAVLDGMIDHLSCGYAVYADLMENGDTAYILDCFVGGHRRYVKLKFVLWPDGERMHVFSAHAHRKGGKRWNT